MGKGRTTCKHHFTRDKKTLDWRCEKCGTTRFIVFQIEHRIGSGWQNAQERWLSE